MIVEIFVVESDEVKVSKTITVENKKAPVVDLQGMIYEAYRILDREIRDEANRITQLKD